jgi:predicted tellurium resistance membrane protein TerC
MFEAFAHTETWISLFTLSLMEIVLGIDNVVFVSIIVNRLPEAQRLGARRIGMGLALGFRLALLPLISWLSGLTTPLFTVAGFGFSGRDLILLAGGLFLMAKSTTEIHHKLEGAEAQSQSGGSSSVTFSGVITQAAILNIVFSIDSVVTAIGLVQNITVMVIAIVLSLAVMLAFSGYISDFIERHPTMKMLALSFLLMIGLMLVVEAFQVHVPKGYVYFAMAFSLVVELLNMRLRTGGGNHPVKLHNKM